MNKLRNSSKLLELGFEFIVVAPEDMKTAVLQVGSERAADSYWKTVHYG